MTGINIECPRCGVVVHSIGAYVNHMDHQHGTQYKTKPPEPMLERRQVMMKPGQCWHLIHKQKLQQCGLDARRCIVRRPYAGDGISNKNISMGPCIVMWLCINHIDSVKKAGYVVVLDTQAV